MRKRGLFSNCPVHTQCPLRFALYLKSRSKGYSFARLFIMPRANSGIIFLRAIVARRFPAHSCFSIKQPPTIPTATQPIQTPPSICRHKYHEATERYGSVVRKTASITVQRMTRCSGKLHMEISNVGELQICIGFGGLGGL